MASARILTLLSIGLALVGVLAVVLDTLARDVEQPPAADPSERVALLEAENAHLKKALERLRAEGALRAESGPSTGPQLEGSGAPAESVGETVDPGPRPSPELFLDAFRRALKAGRQDLAQSYRAALLALGRASVPPLLRAVRDEREDESFRIALLSMLLVLQGPDVGIVALELLDAPGTPPALLDAALAHLPVVEGMMVPASVRALAQDPDAPWAQRKRALQILMGGAPTEAVEAIRRLLAAGLEGDRNRAIQLLAGTNNPAFAPLIHEILESDAPPPTVQSLLNALAAMKGANWATVQATGPPDTPIAGDLPTAWASKTGDMGDVWIEFDFARSVVPDDLRIHETFNAGAVKRVEARQPGGRWFLLWEGLPSAAIAPRFFEPPLARAPARARTIRLVLDTSAVPGWNEIDAVELIGDGRRQWARAVRASSTYGE